MTTEDDFWRMLEADPTDWNTRLILADFLEDRDDPRSMGLRAEVALKVVPMYLQMNPGYWKPEVFVWLMGNQIFNRLGSDYRYASCQYPEDWAQHLPYKTGSMHKYKWTDFDYEKFPEGTKTVYWRYRLTLKEAESDAALAFLKLPRQRQLELLGQVEAVG